MGRWDCYQIVAFIVLFVTFTQDRILCDVGSEDTTCLCVHCKVKGLPCLQPYHSRVVEQHVSVWKSTTHGFGLFARHPMRVKDIICLYSGERRTDAVEGNNYTCKIQGDSKGSETFYIDGRDKPYYSGRWINHSNDPNARLVVPLGGVLSCHDNTKCAILVECIKRIRENEEIFVDYGPSCRFKSKVHGSKLLSLCDAACMLNA